MQLHGFFEAKGLNESAAFYRLWDLFFTPRDSNVREFLGDQGLAAYVRFEQTMQSMPWIPVPGFPHIRQVADGDLSPLIKPAQVLDKQLRRLAWKHMDWKERFRTTAHAISPWARRNRSH
jgi:hypothetical protein